MLHSLSTDPPPMRPTLTPLLAALFTLILGACAPHDEHATLRQAIQKWAGAERHIESIRAAGFLDLYEVRMDGELFYSDARGEHIFVGNVLDLERQRNLTQERQQELSRIDFSALPLNLAAKQVRGNGRRVLATFEDPNCGYCRKLALELEKLDDVTVYTFLLPILSEDSVSKTRAIWCAPDRGRAWRDWIVSGRAPAASDCEAPVDALRALGQKYNVTGTPTLFLADGQRIGGYVPADQLERALSASASARVAQ